MTSSTSKALRDTTKYRVLGFLMFPSDDEQLEKLVADRKAGRPSSIAHGDRKVTRLSRGDTTTELPAISAASALARGLVCVADQEGDPFYVAPTVATKPESNGKREKGSSLAGDGDVSSQGTPSAGKAKKGANA